MLQSSFFRWLGSPWVQSMICSTLLKWKKEFKTKLLGSLCQEMNRIIARYTYNVFQLVRDGVFLGETGWALSLSANLGFVLQSGGCIVTRREKNPQLGLAPRGSSSPHLGGRQKRTLCLIATKTSLLKCCVDKHKPNVTKLAQYLLRERWLLAQL